ncbi:TIR domain-containing protein [Agrobacterium rhizogenes]|nr:TIR domain-containing protein [Rhizobium rhizogenes]
MGSVDYKYFAFISYNHRDQRYAKQVHRLLERIRIPSDAVGGLPDGLKDKKGVRPVFRDQDELSSSSSLPDSLQQNLQASAYLIVLCSPEAAHSRWVNEEIRYFIELGREKNILCLILRGGATFYSDASPSGAFPPALRREDNSLPLAADIRAGKTTLSREVMRLAAGILKVGFDVVYQRERRRRCVSAWNIDPSGGVTGVQF